MTTMTIKLFLVLIPFIGAQLSLIDAQSNTVAVAGSEVTMKCQNTPSGNCINVEWKKQSSSTASIYKNNIIFRDFKDRFSVVNSSGCDLIIKNVSLTDAGRFICEYFNQEKNSVNKASFLIVLEYVPKCSVRMNASSEEIAAEGDEVQFTCEARFSATEGEISMTWKSLENVSVSVESNTTGRLSHSVVAMRSEIPSLECITTFDIPKGIKDLATNIPTGPSCKTQPIQPLYQLTNVTLTPSLSVYSLGSEITCSADGNPPPSYQWQRQSADANGMKENWTDIFGEIGNVFKTSMTAQYNASIYRCVVNNTIRGKSYVLSAPSFQVNGNSDKPGPSGSDHITIIIIASAVAAGVVALLIVIVSVRICQVRRNEAKSKQGNGKSGGGDQMPLKSGPAVNGSISPQMTTIPVASIQPHPRAEAAKRPQIPAPEPKKHKDDSKKKRAESPPQEEVLYADLAMEQGPKRRVQQAPTYDPHAVYADVHLA